MSKYYQVWTALTAITLIGPGAMWGWPGLLATLLGAICLSLGWRGLQDAIYQSIKPNQMLPSRIKAILWLSPVLSFFLIGLFAWGGLWALFIWRLSTLLR